MSSTLKGLEARHHWHVRPCAGITREPASRHTLVCAAVATALAAAAPAAQGEEPALEEVVVTAQKREQSLQDVSAAVTAIGSARLDDAQIRTLEDLQNVAPNINFGNDFNTAKLFVRGIGTNTSVAGSDPGVALHVDGAVISRPEAQLTSLFDLERVEVLRGPQGSLYGRNSVGGSINLITAKPTSEPRGYARVTAGNYDQRVMEAALGGPFSARILGRIAVQTNERDGYGRNPVTGNDVDNLDKRMARVHLQFNFTESFDLLLSGEYYKQDDASNAVKFRSPSFPNEPRLAPLGAGGFAADPRDLAGEYDPRNDTKAHAVTATVGWDLNDHIALRNITNYRDFRVGLLQDVDASGVVNSLATTGQATTIQNRNTYSEQITQELQLQVEGERVNGVLGLYYFHERFGSGPNSIGMHPTSDQPETLLALAAAGVSPAFVFSQCGLPTPADPTVSPPRFCGFSKHQADAYAGFGQLTYAFTPELSLKAGGRYSHETRSEQNPGVIIANGGAGPVRITTVEASRNARTFSDFTPEGGIEWRPNEALLFYYTYSEGFKSGTGEATITTSRIIGPESVQNHELGLKSSLFGRRVNLNLAAFTYDLQGLQVSKTINDPIAGFVTVFENAAETTAKGVEADMLWQATEALRIDAGLSWIDSQFDDFLTFDPLDARNVRIPGRPFNPVPIQLSGNRTRNSPEWAYSLHGEYVLPRFTNGALVAFSTDVSYKSDQYFSEFQRDIEGSDAYTMVDASLKLTAPNGKLHGSIWGRNLTDTFRPAGTFALATAREIGVTWLPPRTYGITLGYDFSPD